MYYEDLLETTVNQEHYLDDSFNQEQNADRYGKLYEKYRLPFNAVGTDGKYYKYVTIENFGTGLHGSQIRNAVTGVYYDYMVGTADEDFLFKVVDSTGRKGKKDPLMLYYDTPEQYERHHFTSVSTQVKQNWVKRVSELARHTTA
jgi:hypothetical protein